MTRKINILDGYGGVAFVLADDSLGRSPTANKPTRQLVSCEPEADALIQESDPFRGAERVRFKREGQNNQSCIWRPKVAFGFINQDELFAFQRDLQNNLPAVGTAALYSAGGVAYIHNARLRPYVTVMESAVLWIVQFTIAGGIPTKTRPANDEE